MEQWIDAAIPLGPAIGSIVAFAFLYMIDSKKGREEYEMGVKYATWSLFIGLLVLAAALTYKQGRHATPPAGSAGAVGPFNLAQKEKK